MDITKFVVSGRDQALLYGDHGTYQHQLAKKLLNCRKKLSIATPRRAKFQKKEDVTAQDISQSHDYLHLLLLTAERAWAHAMTMKSSHAADTDGITGRTRSHIVSRLDRAARTAEHLAELLADTAASGASSVDVLEARAYAALLRGSCNFERQSWEACIRSYSVPYVIYNAFSTAAKGDIYKDLLSETIDPSIRFAAYQLKTPRTVPVPVIARKAFPQSDAALISSINKIDPSILKQGDPEARKGLVAGAEDAPKTLTWRAREVRIEDAAIAIAWGAVQRAKAGLAEKMAAAGTEPKDVAGAYDEILEAAQDAVDATKQAIDELKGEGVSQGDPRMQSLQITWTAVNYEMISWRIGRNRVLTGSDDGAVEALPATTAKRSKGKKKADDSEEASPKAQKNKEDTPARRIARLKEKLALYEGTLQSLDTVKGLPGVPADENLTSLLDATVKYFSALKILAIARSHSILDQDVNALALIQHAFKEFSPALPTLKSSSSSSSIPNITIASSTATFLHELLEGELQRHRALVHIANLNNEAIAKARKNPPVPLIDRLNDYPVGGVDLKNLVPWPPRMELVPLKPIFLDVAWNYIEYPQVNKGGAASGAAAAANSKEEKQPQKRGWFGFGR